MDEREREEGPSRRKADRERMVGQTEPVDYVVSFQCEENERSLDLHGAVQSQWVVKSMLIGWTYHADGNLKAEELCERRKNLWVGERIFSVFGTVPSRYYP